MENIVRKGEIACNKQFLLFSQCFLHYMAFIIHLRCTLKMSSAICFNLDQSNMLSSGNGLSTIKIYPFTDGIGDISNISMISMMNVNETKFNSTTMSTISHMDDADPVENLDITKQVSEMFLDGCKVGVSCLLLFAVYFQY